jgi:hypothetical protein
MIAAHLRKRRPKPHFDEVYLKIDVRMDICGAPSTPKLHRGPVRLSELRVVRVAME